MFELDGKTIRELLLERKMTLRELAKVAFFKSLKRLQKNSITHRRTKHDTRRHSEKISNTKKTN